MEWLVYRKGKCGGPDFKSCYQLTINKHWQVPLGCRMIWVMKSKIMILLLDRTHPVAHWQLHGGKVTVKAI